MAPTNNILNNYVFQLLGTLTTAGTSVSVSTEKETGEEVVFDNAYIVMRNGNGTVIERMKGTASGGTLDLSIRGLPKGQSLTPDPSLYKEWTEGTIVYVTILAQNIATLQDRNTWTGINTFNNDVDVNALLSIGDGGSFEGPLFADLAALNAAFPSPANGLQGAYAIAEGEIYDAIGGSWQPRASGTNPNASTSIAGKVQMSTQAQTDALTTVGGTGAPLVTQQDYIPANAKASPDLTDTWVIYDSATSNTKKYINVSSVVNLSQILNYGDGSDGDVTISVNTTLTRDMFYNNLIVNGGVTLSPDGYKIFVRGTLSGTGTIARNGNNGGNGAANIGASGGIGGAAATALNQGTLNDYVGAGAGGNGGNGTGGAGNPGVNGTAANPSYSNVSSVAGGVGASVGGGGGAGGAGGTAATSTRGVLYNVIYKNNEIISLISNPASWASIFSATPYKGIASSGGGGGSGGSVGATGGQGGGGGGGNGGTIWIAAYIRNFTGTISTTGGTGGAGIPSSGGGGGGGNGGIVYLITHTLISTGTIIQTGGTGGTGATAGTNGNSGVTISLTA